MKTKMFIIITAALIGLFIYSILYNGFSGAESMVMRQTDDPPDISYETTDEKTIKTVMGILNRSNKVTNTQYKLAVTETFTLELAGEEIEKETLYFHEGFSRNTTLISSNVRHAYFKISEKETETIFNLLKGKGETR
ncbi:hypothetical protein [Bacillus sp. KH172YL63]|uniref:hypothetical protein n=1 Tax=Bacillus sp. KH172YL63 TaxID=2709784 RepID=UPI0013E4F2DB|nr:hypothetical protein [Bacillus sp. KH172YL63]BCB02552.1 hypothetical protein KH172YL63_06850 [Bacillus sp. KH172YL63]